jgi:glycosyltransferase involved in cell wall biosynthesis
MDSHVPLVTRLATPHFLVEQLNGMRWHRRARTAVSRALERLQIMRSAMVISPSSALADIVAQRWGLDRSAIRVVPTGIDCSTITESATGAMPPLLAGRRYVLYFGRLEIRKGVDVWIDALPQVMRSVGDVTAVFIGDDAGFHGRPFPDYARERCTNFSERLLFLPRLAHTELFPVVARADLVVMPSRWENLANACLEAMALGRPVIATTGAGFEDVITDGVDGLLVPPGDVGALAKTATAALCDPVRLDRLGAAARVRVREFDLTRMVSLLAHVHRQALAASSAREERAWR